MLHGSAYDYMTNEAMDAQRPFTGARPLSRKHNFGFSVGGPGHRAGRLHRPQQDVLLRERGSLPQPDELSRRCERPSRPQAYRNGDFSAALTGRVLGTDPLGRPIMENAIYDPRTTRTVNGQVVRDPFPNNVIPRELFDPVALQIQSLIPAPDNAELLNNYGPDIQNHRNQWIPTVKIDHNIGSGTKLSGYWSAQFTDQITAPDGMPIPITSRRDQKIYGHTLRVNVDKTLKPTLQLHAGVGFSAFPQPGQLAGRRAQLRRGGPAGIRRQRHRPRRGSP